MRSVYPLKWCPKEFLAGDLDNSKSSRLLGTPKLSKVETLVREMAQNSWDAGTDEWQPAFRIRLREGTADLKANLRILFSEDEPSSPLARALADPNFHVLEILDRGTSGLDGPVDMSEVPEGVPSNFQDLILKVGVPRTSGQGGGTYGFGKTAAYAYSQIGTVIYWSRCVNLEGELEHRFIASAFREKFDMRGVQYTGRHWWGAKAADGSAAPVIGEEAQRLGEALFDWDFPGEETGTSMLILYPALRDTVEAAQDKDRLELTEESDFDEIVERWADQVRKTIRHHLWPKIVPHPVSEQAPMEISLTVHGVDIPLRSESKEMLDHWADALNAVRLAQDAPEMKQKSKLISVHEVTRQGELNGVRKTHVLGHLAISIITGLKSVGEGADLDPERSEQGRVVRMRNLPELVVDAKDWIGEGPDGDTDWIAIYKPVAELDDLYALAEPPAHDDWVAQSEALDHNQSLVITHTERKIKAILNEQLMTSDLYSDSKSPRVSTRKLSKKLSRLIPAGRIGPEVRTSQATNRVAITNGPKIRVLSQSLVRTDERVMQVQELQMMAEGTGDSVQVQLNARYVGIGVSEKLRADEFEVYWEGAEENAPGIATAPIGKEFKAYVHAKQGRALRFTVKERV